MSLFRKRPQWRFIRRDRGAIESRIVMLRWPEFALQVAPQSVSLAAPCCGAMTGSTISGEVAGTTRRYFYCMECEKRMSVESGLMPSVLARDEQPWLERLLAYTAEDTLDQVLLAAELHDELEAFRAWRWPKGMRDIYAPAIRRWNEKVAV